MTTFVVSGLWHGANWTFVIWGALHGAAMILSDATSGLRSGAARLLGLAGPREPLVSLRRLFRVLLTYLFVNLSWVFFRASSVGDAAYIVRRILGGIPEMLDAGKAASSLSRLGLSRYHFVVALASIALLATVEILQHRAGSLRRAVSCWPAPARWALYNAAVLAVALFGYASVRPEFIYFQF